jgi:hypothetical protein
MFFDRIGRIQGMMNLRLNIVSPFLTAERQDKDQDEVYKLAFSSTPDWHTRPSPWRPGTAPDLLRESTS